MSSPLDGNGVAWACIKCNSPRSEDPCPKCGTALTKPADGWEWPTLPDIDRIRALAREVGYAVGVHGSLERDLDLIAAPWVADAVAPLVLARHIAAGLGGEVVDYQRQDKPCGRWSCNIHTPDWTKMIDLSVMPPLASSHTAVEPVARFNPVLDTEDGGYGFVTMKQSEHGQWVPLSTLTAQAAALAKAEGRVEALMAERTSLIATKREQLAAAESEAATLKARLAELEADNARLNRIATDRLYMMEAFRSMLGPIGLKVVAMWHDKRVQRVHHDWGPDALRLTGEERAQTILDWENAPREEIVSVDARRLTHQEKNNG